MKQINENKKFEVNIKEFIALCEQWLNTFVIGKKGFIPNERLIRGYVSEGILPKPERKGKESFYGYKHLIYFLVCRDLFSEKLPLAKINEYFKDAVFEELEFNLLKKYNQVTANDSLEVIGELKKSSQSKIKTQRKQKTNNNFTKSLMLRSYQNSQQSIKEFGSDLTNVFKDEFTTFTLASWLSVAIKTKKLSEIDSDLAFRISNAIKSALLDTNLDENTLMFKEVKQTSDLDLKNQQLERENFTLKKDKSLLENKIKYNEHETHLKDLEINRIENLFHTKQKNLEIQLEERSALYEKQIEVLEARNLQEKKITETDINKKMEEMNLNYQIEIQDQKTIIKQYEEKLLELEKQIKTKK
tara:strand:+ start:100 stop:1173 length:1074 start_codon:yes stop_codon:yes gene_type:complete